MSERRELIWAENDERLEFRRLERFGMKMREVPKGDGRRILQEPDAESASPDLPAFLARPEGAPVYHGFPILEESLSDGWRVGAITEFEDPDGCTAGDAFVVAPDGSRAGLVWEVGLGPMTELIPPNQDRWGVYHVHFRDAVRTRAEFIEAFRSLLPDLKTAYERFRSSAD